MTPDAQLIANALTQVGVAIVFIVAWRMAEKSRETDKENFYTRYEKLQQEYHQSQENHRVEMLQLIRDITFRTPARDLRDTSEVMK